MADTSKSSAGPDGSDLLNTFLEAAQGFVERVGKAMASAAGDDPDAALILSTGQTVGAQFRAAMDEVRVAYRGANAVARRNTDSFLRLQQGTLLAQSAADTAERTLAAGPGRGFFSWVTENLTEIKKLVGMILDFLKLPRLREWWDKIALFLDELWKLIATLLGGIFGFNRREIAAETSAAEVNAMNEAAALVRLTAARARQENEEEE